MSGLGHLIGSFQVDHLRGLISSATSSIWSFPTQLSNKEMPEIRRKYPYLHQRINVKIPHKITEQVNSAGKASGLY
jgi:hypothetical protein